MISRGLSLPRMFEPMVRKLFLGLPTKIVIVIIILLITLFFQIVLTLPYSTVKISSHATIHTFAYLKDGHIYKDGQQLHLFGAVYYKTFGYYLPTREEDVRGMAYAGLNFLGILIGWGYLEPQLGVFDNSYLTHLSNTLDWCQKYGINVLIMISTHSIDPDSPSMPSFLKDRYDSWNESMLGEQINAMRYVARFFKNRTCIVGYKVLHEPSIWYESLKRYYNSSWNEYLQKEYGSVSNLRKAWEKNAYSELKEWEYNNATESWNGKIEWPRSVSAGAASNRDYRMRDFILWYLELSYNVSSRFADAIKAEDPNHLIFWALPFHIPGTFNYRILTYWRCPSNISGFCIHTYPSDMGELASSNGTETMKSIYTSAFSTVKILFPDKAIIVDEVGYALPPIWITSQVSNLFSIGVDGLLMWSWFIGLENSNDINLGYNLKPELGIIQTLAYAHRNGGPSFNPQILVIYPIFKLAYASWEQNMKTVFEILEFLAKNHVSFGLAPDEAFANPEFATKILNKYTSVIYLTTFANPNSVQNVVNWDKENSTNSVLYMGALDDCYGNNNYQNWTRYNFRGYITDSTDVASSLEPLGVGDDILIAEESWGDIKQGTQLSFHRTYGMKILKEKLGNLHIILTRADGTVALWYNATNKAVYLYAEDGDNWAAPFEGNNGLQTIITSYLKWQSVQIDTLTSSNLIYKYCPDENILLMYEHAGFSRTTTIALEQLPEGQYNVFNVTHPRVELLGTYTHSQLRTGLQVYMNSFSVNVFVIKPVAIPRLVYANGTNYISDDWIDSNQTLRIRILGIANGEISVYVYWPNMNSNVKIYFSNGTTVSAQGYYDSTNKLIKLGILPNSTTWIDIGIYG